jgi:hypothetical protein
LVDVGRSELPTPWLQTEISNLPCLAGAGTFQGNSAVSGKSRREESPYGRTKTAQFTGLCHNCYHILRTVVTVETVA